MKIRNQRGTALVETALVLPFLMLILFGITEFGRAMYMTNTLNEAAREGARKGCVMAPFSQAAITDHVKSCIPFDSTGIQVTVTPSSPTYGQTISVDVTLHFDPVVSFINQLNNITLNGHAKMIYEL